MVLFESNYTDVRLAVVGLMRGFQDTVMCGDYSKLGKDDVENGPTFSVCCVELSEVVLDGSGMPRITFGPRCIPRRRNDGSMSMPVKRLGIIRDYMLRDGERRCPIALPSRLMARRMSPVAMCARLTKPWNGIDVQKKLCSTSRMRSATFEGRTCQRMNGSVLRRKTAGKTGNSEDTSLHQLLNQLSTTSDQSIQQPCTTPTLQDHKKTRSCLQSSLVGRVVLRNGLLLEEKLAHGSHRGIPINVESEE
jgi:hypothetical protein